MDELEAFVLERYIACLSPKSIAKLIRLFQDVEKAGNIAEMQGFQVEFEYTAEEFKKELFRQKFPQN